MKRKFTFHEKSAPLPEYPVIFVDGSDHLSYRQGFDTELSHWVPNRTPTDLKADTSTGICLKFHDSKYDQNQSLIMNNHLDSDGVLSAFTLIFPALARKHSGTIIGASRMGDFGSGGDKHALKLWVALVNTIHKTRHKSPQNAYIKGMEIIHSILNGGEHFLQNFEEANNCLQRTRQWVDEGQIERTKISERFTHFHIPMSLRQKNENLVPYYEPNFDAGVEQNHLLPRQIRNQMDEQRVQLISVEEPSGYSYDLLIPQYMWAETPDSWRFPGFNCLGNSNSYELVHPKLAKAAQDLNNLEANQGSWLLAQEMTPFISIKGRGFPVILSFLHDKRLTPSSIAPRVVVDILQGALKDG